MLLPSTSLETAPLENGHNQRDTLEYALARVECCRGQVPLLEREQDLLLAAQAEAWRNELYPEVVSLVAGLAYIAGRLQDAEQGQRILLQGIHACRKLGDERQAALFLNRLCGLLFAQGQYDHALAMWNESLSIARALDRSACLWEPLGSFPYIVDILRDYETAFLFTQALLNSGRRDDLDTMAVASFIRGFCHHLVQDEERALSDFSACQHLLASYASPSLYKRLFEIEVQAEVARVQGDFACARTYTMSALSLAETLCDPYIPAVLLWDEVMFACRRGILDDIYPLARHLVSLSGAIKAPHYFRWCLFFIQHVPEALQGELFHKLSLHAPQEVAALLPLPANYSCAVPSAPLLSRREQTVLRHVAEGCTNREIAGQLVIAVSTVKKHLEHIYSKLDVSSRTQAVARGREWKLLG